MARKTLSTRQKPVYRGVASGVRPPDPKPASLKRKPGSGKDSDLPAKPGKPPNK
jgi:hypothetical protein